MVSLSSDLIKQPKTDLSHIEMDLKISNQTKFISNGLKTLEYLGLNNRESAKFFIKHLFNTSNNFFPNKGINLKNRFNSSHFLPENENTNLMNKSFNNKKKISLKTPKNFGNVSFYNRIRTQSKRKLKRKQLEIQTSNTVNLTITTHSSFYDHSNKHLKYRTHNNSLISKFNHTDNLFLTNCSLDKDNNFNVKKRNISSLTESISKLKEPVDLDKMKVRRTSLHLLKIPELKKRFEKNDFEHVLKLFEKNSLKNERLSKKMINFNDQRNKVKNVSQNLNIDVVDREDIIDNEQLMKKRKEPKIVKITENGIINMINKANADLMKFGDCYLKYNDINFFNNSRTILNEYKKVRIKAKVKNDSPVFFKSRLPILKHNQLRILKKYNSILKEYSKVKKFVNNRETFNKENKY